MVVSKPVDDVTTATLFIQAGQHRPDSLLVFFSGDCTYWDQMRNSLLLFY